MSTPNKLIVPERMTPFPTPALTNEATAMIAMIDRAARDSTVDMDKLERLMALRREMAAEERKAAFNVAMSAAQSEMGRVSADAVNPQTRSRYASYANLDRELRPIYSKHGFALSFDEADSPKPDHVRILCYVSHNAGHTQTYHKDMPADGKGAKGGDVMTKTHATGAAQSYGMRYLVKGIFNVAVGEEDTDGNDTRETIGPGQVAALEKLIAEVGADKTKFLAYIKADSLDKILCASYETAKAQLELKRKRKQS